MFYNLCNFFTQICVIQILRVVLGLSYVSPEVTGVTVTNGTRLGKGQRALENVCVCFWQLGRRLRVRTHAVFTL